MSNDGVIDYIVLSKYFLVSESVKLFCRYDFSFCAVINMVKVARSVGGPQVVSGRGMIRPEKAWFS